MYPVVSQYGGRLRKDALHGVGVERLHLLDVLVDAEPRRAGGGVCRVLPVEDYVLGRERLAVVPLHATLQFPRDRHPILRHAAVLEARDLLGQHGHHVASGIKHHERLVEDGARVPILETDRDLGVEQNRCVPRERLEMAAASPLRGGKGRARLRLGHAGAGEHLAREGSGEAKRDHGADERAP